MTQQLVPAQYRGHLISFDEGAWFCATQAAAKFGKNPHEWLRLPATKEYIEALDEENPNAGKSRIWIKTKRGQSGGTWLHPDLAVIFARWLDIRFSIWCDRQIKQIIAGNHPHYNWKKIRHEATASHKVMAEALRIVREEQGKATLTFHYSNECRLINWALTGDFTSLDRNSLSEVDLAMLAQLETRNSVLVGKGIDYQTRKAALRVYAIDHHHHIAKSAEERLKDVALKQECPAPAGGIVPL